MIINDLDLEGITFVESKADAPLIIDADAPLSGAIMPQCFQVIRGRQT